MSNQIGDCKFPIPIVEGQTVGCDFEIRDLLPYKGLESLVVMSTRPETVTLRSGNSVRWKEDRVSMSAAYASTSMLILTLSAVYSAFCAVVGIGTITSIPEQLLLGETRDTAYVWRKPGVSAMAMTLAISRVIPWVEGRRLIKKRGEMMSTENDKKRD